MKQSRKIENRKKLEFQPTQNKSNKSENDKESETHYENFCITQAAAIKTILIDIFSSTAVSPIIFTIFIIVDIIT